jgi:hypothetical protein
MFRLSTLARSMCYYLTHTSSPLFMKVILIIFEYWCYDLDIVLVAPKVSHV